MCGEFKECDSYSAEIRDLRVDFWLPCHNGEGFLRDLEGLNIAHLSIIIAITNSLEWIDQQHFALIFGPRMLLQYIQALLCTRS